MLTLVCSFGDVHGFVKLFPKSLYFVFVVGVTYRRFSFVFDNDIAITVVDAEHASFRVVYDELHCRVSGDKVGHYDRSYVIIGGICGVITLVGGFCKAYESQHTMRFAFDFSDYAVHLY